MKVTRRAGADPDIEKLFNGTIKEGFNALVTSDGTTVTLNLEKVGGGDLTLQFSDGLTLFDTTPTATITLTAGADNSATENFIYILQSNKTLTKSTSDFPTTEHIKIGYYLVPSAGFVQTNGVYINQNWNEELADPSNNMGDLAHISEKLRRLNASYFSGVDGNGTDNYLTPTAGNTELKSTSGIVYQKHKQTYPAVDTSTGDVVLIKNWSGDSFHDLTNLYDIVSDSTGTTIGNNKYFNLIIWGAVNKSGEYSPLIINLPSGFYNTQSGAEADASSFDDFTIPREFNRESSTGFLIARITIQMKTGGGTWVVSSTTDLRGQIPTTATGGVSSIVTQFIDNTFLILDETDNTKELAFDVGTNVSTGTTRTITMADFNVDLAGLVPYTGATQDVDLGSKKLIFNSQDINVKRRGGSLELVGETGQVIVFSSSSIGTDTELMLMVDTGLGPWNHITNPMSLGSSGNPWNNIFLEGTIDLGVNTIADGEMNGPWNMNSGIMTNVNIDSGTIDGITGTANFASLTASATITAEQITSTDDITMQGHLLTMGDSGAATDTVLSFLGSTNSATITYDESADLFNFGDAGITTTGIVNIGDTTPSTTSFLNVDGRVIIRGTQVSNDPLLDIGTLGASDSNNILLRSGAGTFSFFVSGAQGTFMGLTEAGDGGIRVSTNNSLLFGSNVNPRLILTASDEVKTKGQLIAESGGPELMSDPLFNVNPGGWTLGGNWAITGGRMQDTFAEAASASITLGQKTDGTVYRVEMRLDTFSRGQGGTTTALFTMGGKTVFSFNTNDEQFDNEVVIAYVTPINSNDFVIDFDATGADGQIKINEIFVKEQLPTLLEGDVVIGAAAAGKDYTLTFKGESDNGVITYDEDNNLFNLADTGITTTGIFKGNYESSDGSTGITQTETTVNTFNITIKDGLITSFTKLS